MHPRNYYQPPDTTRLDSTAQDRRRPCRLAHAGASENIDILSISAFYICVPYSAFRIPFPLFPFPYSLSPVPCSIFPIPIPIFLFHIPYSPLLRNSKNAGGSDGALPRRCDLDTLVEMGMPPHCATTGR
jgi:hypothetical protein